MTKEKKNVIWNMIGASFNAFNSLFFIIIIKRINGIDDAGIFTYCFATACLLYIVGVYQGRAYQVTDITGKKSDTDYIYNRIFTCVIMMVVVIAFPLIKGYDIYKILIFILINIFRCIEAFSESIYAIIQKKGNLYQVGRSLFAKAVGGILIFLIVDLLTNSVIYSIISLIITNILILVFYDLRNAKKIGIAKSKFNFKTNFDLLKTGFFTFILTFLGIYLINVPRYAIDDILTNEIQTVFGIIIMPATFMSLLGQYIIQPSLTKLSSSIERKDYITLNKTITNLILIIVGLGISVFGIAYFLEAPILGIVYAIDLNPYFISMMIIMAGAIMYSLSSILSYILITFRKTGIQAITYTVVSILATILAYNLVAKNEIIGASITYTITMTIIAILFLIYLLINMKKYKKEWKK